MDADYEGPWYFNIGENEKDYKDGANRRWEDNVEHGFVSAGRLAKSVREIRRLSQGSIIYGYLNAHGYVGFGRLLSDPIPARDLVLPSGRSLSDSPLRDSSILSYDETDENLPEYAAGVEWFVTVSRSDAKSFSGIFYFRGAVCKLTNAPTLDFLEREFGDPVAASEIDLIGWLGAVLARLKLTGKFDAAPDKATKYYVDIRTGIPGVHYSIARKAKTFKVGLYFETPDAEMNQRLFRVIESQRLGIEEATGFPLEWRGGPAMKRCCAEMESPSDLGERPLRDRAVQVLLKMTNAFSGPFSDLTNVAQDWK